VELLVVIAIIGLLIALLLPAVQAVRESSRRAKCQSNMKQIGLALLNFHDVQKRFPPSSQGMVGTCNSTTNNSGTNAGWSWSTFLLPFLEEQSLFDALRVTSGSGQVVCGGPTVASASQRAAATTGGRDQYALQRTVLQIFVCPSAGDGNLNFGLSGATYAKSNYKGVAGLDFNGVALGSTPDGSQFAALGLFRRVPLVSDGPAGAKDSWAYVRSKDVTDGLSKTLAIGEVFSIMRFGTPLQKIDESIGGTFRGGVWVGAISPELQNGLLVGFLDGSPNGTIAGVQQYPFASRHPGGVLFGLADGSCRFVSENADATTLALMSCISDGQATAVE
jgi:type II secretory pathway pseudopilin PulG